MNGRPYRRQLSAVWYATAQVLLQLPNKLDLLAAAADSSAGLVAAGAAGSATELMLLLRCMSAYSFWLGWSVGTWPGLQHTHTHSTQNR